MNIFGCLLMCLDPPLQSELCLLLLVLDDLADGPPALFYVQVRVKVHQVLVLLRGRCLVAVLCL